MTVARWQRRKKKRKTRLMSSSTDDVTAYALAVQSGEIVAGPHVRDAAARHLRDMEEAEGRGYWFDVEAADRFFRFCEAVLRLSEGQFDGVPFRLHPSQKFICGSLFGWKRKSDGKRRFRRAYIEQGKGNGKSPMVGAIGLYGLVADGEAGAQIYAAGATKEQAGILFRDAVAMVDQSPSLDAKIRRSGGPGREYNLAHMRSGSFFRPVSRETKKTGSGPRPHFALCDEVHEHPDGGVIEILERGFKFREQPLLVMITNSGSDRQSICWHERKHAVAVAAGDVEDDTTFAYVCALDEERTVSYGLDAFIRHAVESCTCSAKTIQIDHLPTVQDFVSLVISGQDGKKTLPKGWGVKTIQNATLLLDAFATLATRDLGKSETPAAQKSAKNTCANIIKAKERLSLTASEIKSTESARKSLIPTGKPIEPERENTGLPRSSTTRSKSNKAADAEFAAQNLKLSEWITATTEAMFGDCCATTAMRELVCSEIMSKLFSAHCPTCKICQRSRLESGKWVATLPADDPFEDPSCWIKANPLLGVTITEEYLSIQVAQARNIPAKANGIRRLHFCEWTDAESAWISRSAWEAIEDHTLDIEDFRGRAVFAGLDLSAKADLTAKALVFPDGETEDGQPKFAAFVHGYTPEETLKARAEKDGAPYDLWVDAGFITATPGKKTRLDFVAQDLLDDAAAFDLDFVAYDNFLIADFEAILGDMGAELPMLDHPQGWNKRKRTTADGQEITLWMPGSIDELETLILEGRLRVHVNPALRAAVSSATFDRSPADLRRFTKHKATARIDMAVALAMAVGAATARDFEASSPTPWDVDPEYTLVV